MSSVDIEQEEEVNQILEREASKSQAAIARKTSDTTFNHYITHTTPNYQVKVPMLNDRSDIIRRNIDTTGGAYAVATAEQREKNKRLARQQQEQGPDPAFLINQVIKDYGVTWFDKEAMLPKMRELANGKLKTHEELFESDPAYREEYIKELETGGLDEMIKGILEEDEIQARKKRSLLISDEQIKKY